MKRTVAGTLLFLAAVSMPAFAARNVRVINVAGTTETCCIGEGPTLPDISSYWAQSFVALGKSIRGFQFYALDNLGPIYNGPFKFRVLLVDGEPNAAGIKIVLFESDTVAVPFVANGGRFTTIDVDMSCAKLREGDRYTWIIDANVTRDGVLDVGGIFTTVSNDAGYPEGQAYLLFATGQGRKVDLSATWFGIPDIAFHMAFYNERDTPSPPAVDPDQTISVGGKCIK